MRRARTPPSKKSLSPSLPFSSAEGVALTTFWRLNSIFETDPRYLVQSCPLVAKAYYCTVLVLCFSPKASTKDIPDTNVKHPCVPYSQGVPPGPRLPTNGSLGVMSAQSQPRPPAPNNQQKGPAKTQAMQRQLNQPQHPISSSVSDVLHRAGFNRLWWNLVFLNNLISNHVFVFPFQDKDSAHDQFSRHLTRPPPDYKQSRSMVGVQQGNIFTGKVRVTFSDILSLNMQTTHYELKRCRFAQSCRLEI